MPNVFYVLLTVLSWQQEDKVSNVNRQSFNKILAQNLQFILSGTRDYVVNEMHGKQANLVDWTGGQAKSAVHVSYQIFPNP